MELATIDAASERYLGEWKHLVSTTNWEKGRIINQWRAALVESGAAASEYSDDAWSRYVGNVTPQHVGRLRRVFERFAEFRESYPGLYWSHFQAALDWSDAEMWLEGAVQNGWSISEMRRTRWETLGGDPTPEVNELATEPWDEDAESSEAELATGTIAEVRAPERGRARDDDANDEAPFDRAELEDEEERSGEWDADEGDGSEPIEVRPFANLPSLPSDVSDAFESMKLAILRHKLAGWEEISQRDMLATLGALGQLVTAPAE